MTEITESLSTFMNSILEGVGSWAPRVLGAIVAFIIGLWLVGLLMKGVSKLFESKHLDATLKPFLTMIISVSLKAVLFISVAGIVGINVASFIALLGIVGAAIALGFQGSLGHLAAGIMLLFFRPFKVGDLIEINGELGFVKEISVFVTIIETFQNKTAIIPNGTIMANKIINYTSIGNLRVDMAFAVRYGSDLQKAMTIVEEVLKNDVNVLKDPAPRVAVNNLGENAIELVALPYASVEGYWDVYWDTRQKIVEALVSAQYEAPLPQRVVTMSK
ncbi:MAG: mechanosensitive ion channel [Flavobacteriaceae bacterium]|nr:mechanosensitive ion channel [Flavobacteriaceae bacterium]